MIYGRKKAWHTQQRTYTHPSMQNNVRDIYWLAPLHKHCELEVIQNFNNTIQSKRIAGEWKDVDEEVKTITKSEFEERAQTLAATHHGGSQSRGSPGLWRRPRTASGCTETGTAACLLCSPLCRPVGQNIRSWHRVGPLGPTEDRLAPYLDVVVAEESLQLLVLVGGAAAAVGETHQPAMTG